MVALIDRGPVQPALQGIKSAHSGAHAYNLKSIRLFHYSLDGPQLCDDRFEQVAPPFILDEMKLVNDEELNIEVETLLNQLIK